MILIGLCQKMNGKQYLLVILLAQQENQKVLSIIIEDLILMSTGSVTAWNMTNKLTFLC